MNSVWFNDDVEGDAPADNNWGDGGLSTNSYSAGEGFGCFASVPWEEHQKLIETCGETYESLFKVCRALTEICNLARCEVPDFYKKYCANYVEGDDDVRPVDFLIEEYCPRQV